MDEERPHRIVVEDPKDHEFIATLILVVEHFDAYTRLRAEENHAKEAVWAVQLQLDVCSNDYTSYLMLEEPAIDDLVQDRKKEEKWLQAKLKECLQVRRLVSGRLQRNTTQRTKLLGVLYDGAQRFVDRDLIGKVQCDGLELSPSFDFHLIRLKHSYSELIGAEKSTKRARRALIRAQGRLQHGRSENEVKTERKQLLADFQSEEATLERQKESQTRREQIFFIDLARPALIAAGLLPSTAPPRRSATPDDLERMQDRSKEDGAGRGTVAETQTQPQRQNLFAARRRAAKANDALARLRSSYMEHLAKTLSTYSEMTKQQFDRRYQREHEGIPYETSEAEAMERVRQAEAECEAAWREAVEAGVTDLPPSPHDLGDRSEDGKVDSESSGEVLAEKQAHDEFKPHVDRWNRHVATSGSPADPEVSGPRPASAEPGTPPPPPGSRPPTPGVETETSKPRVDRYTTHQQQMKKRALEQEAERVKQLVETEEVERAPKRRCIIL